jgi:hypothetical protein
MITAPAKNTTFVGRSLANILLFYSFTPAQQEKSKHNPAAEASIADTTTSASVGANTVSDIGNIAPAEQPLVHSSEGTKAAPTMATESKLT